MTVYAIVQLKMIDRAAYDRYQARFFEAFRMFRGRLRRRSYDWRRDSEADAAAHRRGPTPKPKPKGNDA